MSIVKALPFYHYTSSEYRHIRYRILCHQKGVSYYTAKAKEWKKANPEKVKQQWTKYNHNLKNIEYRKQYYLNQKARINRRNSLFYLQNKDRIKEKRKQYYQKNKNVIKQKTKKYYESWKTYNKFITIFHYTEGRMMCQNCDEDIIELLTIDHIEGGGNKHRKETGKANLYVWLRKNNYPQGFQILCYNCNLVKPKVTPERYTEITKRLRTRKNTLLSNNYGVEF